MSYDADNFPPLPASWTAVPVGDASDSLAPRAKVPTNTYLADGPLAVVDQGARLVGGYTAEPNMAVETKLPVVVFGDHTRALKFVDFPFAAGADGIKILRPHECWFPRLFFHFLRAVRLPDRGYARHYQFLRRTRFSWTRCCSVRGNHDEEREADEERNGG